MSQTYATAVLLLHMQSRRAKADLRLGCCKEQRPRRNSQVEAINDPRDEDGLQVPGVGHRRSNHTVLRQSNHGTIIEHSQQHNQQSWEVPADRQHARLVKPVCRNTGTMTAKMTEGARQAKVGLLLQALCNTARE